MATISRQITDDFGKILLWDIWSKQDKNWYFEPCLEFEKVSYDSLWDNSDYVHTFLKGLYKNKKASLKELKIFCNENKLEYSYTLETLLDIYETSKKLGWWKKFVKKQ